MMPRSALEMPGMQRELYGEDGALHGYLTARAKQLKV
jgi:hypothetical protein